MATERIPDPDEQLDASRGYTVRRIEGATYPLPSRTDQELAAMRAAHPDQAWFWTRAFYDKERAAEADAEARRAAGETPTIYYSDEEFEAALRARSHVANHTDADV